MYQRSFSFIRVALQVFSPVCLLLAASAALAAPAPLGSKAVPPPPLPNCELAGTWVMQWQNGTGTATFFREGGYCCDWCGQRWIGSWRIEAVSTPTGMSHKLIVTEARPPDGPNVLPAWYTWEVSLDASKRKGRLSLGGEFSLESRKPAKPDF
jgi:hypothetical protein